MAPQKLPKDTPKIIDVMQDLLGEGQHPPEVLNRAAEIAQEALSPQSTPEVIQIMKGKLPEGASTTEVEAAVLPAQKELARKLFFGKTSPEAQ
jgi:hypothetical protein